MRASNKIKEQCASCSLLPSTSERQVGILGACLTSIEPHTSLCVLYNDTNNKDEKKGNSSNLSTPQDASVTHILVIPNSTTVRMQSPLPPSLSLPLSLSPPPSLPLPPSPSLPPSLSASCLYFLLFCQILIFCPNFFSAQCLPFHCSISLLYPVPSYLFLGTHTLCGSYQPPSPNVISQHSFSPVSRQSSPASVWSQSGIALYLCREGMW